MDKISKKIGERIARPYQLRLLEHAIKHNSIVYLPTGSGKTYIAIMLIRHFSKDLNKPIGEGGKRCIFLCNTVELSRQNAQEISNATNFRVGLFIGDVNVENWSRERWEIEIARNQIFVGTCQVFVDMLAHKFLSISNLSCVIMDECHHATKLHPMHRFMSLFALADKAELPRVIGLTGVLLKTSKKGDILKTLEDLEAVFGGRIITVQNMDEFSNVMLFSTAPKEQMILYSDEYTAFDIESHVKSIAFNCCEQIKDWDLGYTKYSKNLQSLREPLKMKQIKSLLNDFVHQMDDLGIYAASIAILGVIVLLEINKRNADSVLLRNTHRYIITQCERIRHLLVKKMNSLDCDDDDTEMEKLQNIILTFSKPKLQALLAFLIEEFNGKQDTDISCLVFVQRRHTAKCLFYVIKHFVATHSGLSHIIPDFMVGRSYGMTYAIDLILDSKWNSTAVQRFRRKECNLIVCSSVLEEGIDVQACNYVISFDPISQFSSYLQMKGRARSQGSLYVVLCSKLVEKNTAEKITTFQKIDVLLKNYLITRNIDRNDLDESTIAKQFTKTIKPFITPSGAVLQAESAVILLNRYCQALPHDSFTQSAPTWSIVSNDANGIQVSLQLPMQSSLKDIIYSDVMVICKWAKMSAAFKACIALFRNGELNDSLLPITRQHIITNVFDLYFAKWRKEPDDTGSVAGSRKNKRNYERIYPAELIGALPIPGEVAYAYCIKVESDFGLQKNNATLLGLLHSNSSYAIVLRHKLPALASMPLFMTQGPLKVVISRTPFEFVISDEEELKKLKVFNKMIFCDIRKFWKDFLAFDARNGPNSFLIAPVQDGCAIDWALVCNFQQLTPMRATTEAERLHMEFQPKDFLGKVVNTWYGSDENIRFVVTKIRHDLTPLSAFEIPGFESYADYVKQKYKQNVMNNDQFLIEVQALTTRSNFFINAINKTPESRRLKRASATIILIPEMCHNFWYPGDMWLKALFLPTILHRVHYLLNAEKLRLDVNQYLGITTPADYQPAAIQIDYSLRRVGSQHKSKEQPKAVSALDSTKQLDMDPGNWNTFMEPIDIIRNINGVYPIEIDYYYQFVKNMLGDMECGELDDGSCQKASICQLEAFKPSMDRLGNLASKPDRHIQILSRHLEPLALRTAEQFEFLAAITAGSALDVYDMERFELLGDSFLKISVSLLLMHQHPVWNEGYLTTIKSQIVSNKNLLYCMREKYDGTFICSSKFEPTQEWLPPMAAVPTNVLNAIEYKGLSANCLEKLKLTDDEINSGVCDESSLESLCSDSELSETSTDYLNEYLYKQTVSDKIHADCLEAILGVCVQNYGIEKSFEMLDYFGIYNDPEKVLLPKLLQINLGSPVLKADVIESQIDEHLLNYEFLEKNLQYTFKDRAYLLQALTHPSYPANRITSCYQQLEFLGDAVLDFLVSCYVFEKCKHMNPGEMTDLRSALVNNVTLGCVCVRNRFHQFMLYESPSLSETIKNFVGFQNTQGHRVTEQVNILLEETILVETFNMAQNIDVPKALSDVLEALIGAVFLDSGNDLLCTWNVICHLLEIEFNEFTAKVPIDPVRQLHEYRGAKPIHRVCCVESDVVMNKCTFLCRDVVKTVIGCGANKITAKKAASKMALQILHKNN